MVSTYVNNSSKLLVKILVIALSVSMLPVFVSCDDDGEAKNDSDDYWNNRAPSQDYHDDDRHL